MLFDAEQPLLYAWMPCDESSQENFTTVVRQLAEKIANQLGRGTDLAWAWAEIIDETELTNRLDDYVGTVHLLARWRREVRVVPHQRFVCQFGETLPRQCESLRSR